jgi:hypothetical protein
VRRVIALDEVAAPTVDARRGVARDGDVPVGTDAPPSTLLSPSAVPEPSFGPASGASTAPAL